MRNALLPTRGLVHILVNSLSGIFIACTMMFLWVSSLVILFSIDIAQIPLPWLALAVLWRTFLHTGLFITAHDAIHGTILPLNRQVNDWIGTVATRLYALLPYETLAQKHRLHHRYPASANDPDFCAEGQSNPVLWYVKFMRGYLDSRQQRVLLVGMTIIFTTLLWGFNIPVANLLLFWVLPLLLSSFQLFYFGIFLPHRRPLEGYSDRHRAQSSDYSLFWSFITCYHFGYHWEHHEYPYLPWYRLPSAVRE